MSVAREALFDMLKARLDDEHANRCLDAYRIETQRELVHSMRRQLAAGLKMPGFASVIVQGGGFEPFSVTHILDAWDPDRDGSMRPAREALEELRGWPTP